MGEAVTDGKDKADQSALFERSAGLKALIKVILPLKLPFTGQLPVS
jgi:hypothetical protein